MGVKKYRIQKVGIAGGILAVIIAASMYSYHKFENNENSEMETTSTILDDNSKSSNSYKLPEPVVLTTTPIYITSINSTMFINSNEINSYDLSDSENSELDTTKSADETTSDAEKSNEGLGQNTTNLVDKTGSTLRPADETTSDSSLNKNDMTTTGGEKTNSIWTKPSATETTEKTKSIWTKPSATTTPTKTTTSIVATTMPVKTTTTTSATTKPAKTTTTTSATATPAKTTTTTSATATPAKTTTTTSATATPAETTTTTSATTKPSETTATTSATTKPSETTATTSATTSHNHKWNTKVSYKSNGDGTHTIIKTGTCECGETSKSETKESCKHTNWKSAGIQGEERNCTECGHVEKRDHNWKTSTSCKSNGDGTHTIIKTGTCECGETSKSETKESCKHTNWKSAGIQGEEKYCTECGHVEMRSHSFKETTTYVYVGNSSHKVTTKQECQTCSYVAPTKESTASCGGQQQVAANGDIQKTCPDCHNTEILHQHHLVTGTETLALDEYCYKTYTYCDGPNCPTSYRTEPTYYGHTYVPVYHPLTGAIKEEVCSKCGKSRSPQSQVMPSITTSATSAYQPESTTYSVDYSDIEEPGKVRVYSINR